MPGIDELLEELAGRGLASADADRLRNAYEASPIRKELKETRDQLKASQENEAKHLATARAATFEKVGIKVKSNLLATPADLDVTSEDAVKAWAITEGLIEAQGGDAGTSTEEREAITKAQGAGTGTKPIATGAEAFAQVVQGATSFEDYMSRLTAADIAKPRGR